MLSPELEARLGELADLSAVGALLGWDQQTMMPPRGGELRANVMATITTIGHERQTSAELGELLAAAEPEGPTEEAVVRVARRLVLERTGLVVGLAHDLVRPGAGGGQHLLSLLLGEPEDLAGLAAEAGERRVGGLRRVAADGLQLGGHLGVLLKLGEPLVGVELGRRYGRSRGDRLEHDATFLDGNPESVPATEP